MHAAKEAMLCKKKCFMVIQNELLIQFLLILWPYGGKYGKFIVTFEKNQLQFQFEFRIFFVISKNYIINSNFLFCPLKILDNVDNLPKSSKTLIHKFV